MVGLRNPHCEERTMSPRIAGGEERGGGVLGEVQRQGALRVRKAPARLSHCFFFRAVLLLLSVGDHLLSTTRLSLGHWFALTRVPTMA